MRMYDIRARGLVKGPSRATERIRVGLTGVATVGTVYCCHA